MAILYQRLCFVVPDDWAQFRPNPKRRRLLFHAKLRTYEIAIVL
jgi:hypothetical protein